MWSELIWILSISVQAQHFVFIVTAFYFYILVQRCYDRYSLRSIKVHTKITVRSQHRENYLKESKNVLLPKADMQFPSANNPLFMFTPSLNRFPVAWVFCDRSDPAKSTK